MLMILARLVRSESFWAVVKVHSPHNGPEVSYPRRVPSTFRFRKFPGKPEGVWCSILFLSSFPRETREFP